MTHTPFTVRNVAKYVVQGVVAHKVTSLAETAITNHTRFEEDDMIVNLGSHVVGWGVASQLKPLTDAIVDRTADFAVARRTRRQEKKDQKSTES